MESTTKIVEHFPDVLVKLNMLGWKENPRVIVITLIPMTRFQQLLC